MFVKGILKDLIWVMLYGIGFGWLSLVSWFNFFNLE